MHEKSERFAKVAQEKRVASIKRDIKRLTLLLELEKDKLKRGIY